MKLPIGKIAAAFFSCLLPAAAGSAFEDLPDSEFRVLSQLPHAVEDSTQGLEFHDEVLLESTGRYGHSRILRRHWQSGELLTEHRLPRNRFGEGLTRVGERILQLSWRSQRGYIYDLALQPLGQFSYRGQGWGLCFDGKTLWRSDGSDALHAHETETFAHTGSLKVTLAGTPLTQINELECVGDRIYANVWHRDWIVAIDPNTGAVVQRWDLEALRYRFRPPAGFDPREDVLNGIAYHQKRKTFFVTGKRWPALFEVDLHPAGEEQDR